MKYLDTKRSENLTKGLKFYLTLMKIVSIIGIAISFIYMIVISIQLSQSYYSSVDSILLMWVMYILGLALAILVIQLTLWLVKMFWNAVIAWTESAEHNIAHIKAIHYDGNFNQINNDNPN